jgi:Putative transmembrane protein (PGPGW)
MKFFSGFWAAFKAVAAPLRKFIIALIGGTVLLIGIALIVLPGPAFIVIPLGLAILATEFAWARRAVTKTRAMVAKARGRQPEPAAK